MMFRSSCSSTTAPVTSRRKVTIPIVVPTIPEPTLLALAIMVSSADASLVPMRPPSSPTMAPCAASRPKASPATAMAASSMGASENTVKKAMEAPRLMARSFHQPASATFRSRPVSENMQEPILPDGSVRRCQCCLGR